MIVCGCRDIPWMLKRLCILVWGNVVSYRYQLSSTGLLCHLRPIALLIFCLYDLSIEACDVKSLIVIILLSVSSVYISLVLCFYIFVFYTGCMNVNKHILFSYWEHLIMPLFSYDVWFKICFLWYEHCYPHLCCFCLHEISFFISLFQCVYVFHPESSLYRYHTARLIFFFLVLSTTCTSFDQSFYSIGI